ncbi:hypothetical protein GCM10010329_04980 [Streptomyces spiroverticillatus]|uniref:Uncharacterized protein n=1 Tax=Streptomyces finlayi TaxID=67296 RepID=A0A918WSM8_9ACTN|nr:hypothetical protein [Streptomyces finlayi]GGZ87930.1 hypothetical protein GCM10010329_04980 [Streptomyces spiroverticillatus]GHC79051.1 hypothetical protein GCM10010334_04960 [Streptomyces finlayi]
MRHRLRSLRRLALLLLVLGLAWATAPAAYAGGPTSVLLACPVNGKTAARYASDLEYRYLLELLEPPSRKATGPADRPGLEVGMDADEINVTWLVNDSVPWRLQQVYVREAGRTVWIHTASDDPADTEGSWHKAADPVRLAGLLKRWGLRAPATDEAVVPSWPTHGPPQSWYDRHAELDLEARRAAIAAEAPAPVAAPRPVGAADGWWWSIPGLAAGAVGAVLFLRWRAAREAGPGEPDPPGPRGQLIDL